MSDAPDTRAVDLTVEIRATPEQVWRAITDPDELTRWFPPLASGDPREGGHLTVAWEEGGEWTSRIVAWEPGVHLRLEDELPEEVREKGVVTAIDYFIEARGGTTVVRLVNSGFSADAEWDDYFHMLENGWTFFLWNLKHYLERHPGTKRRMISVRPTVDGSREEVWGRLFGADGPIRAGDPGQPFRLSLGNEVLEGTTVLSDAPWAFAGVLPSLGDATLHVELEGKKLGVWLGVYGMEEGQVDHVRAALEPVIEGASSAG